MADARCPACPATRTTNSLLLKRDWAWKSRATNRVEHGETMTRKIRTLGPPAAVCLLTLIAAPSVLARVPQEKVPAVEPSELKKMSIEELMEIDVTSVSRRTEPVSGAAAAITVITGEDIRRSGANNLPDALRMVVSLHVAQFDGRTWAISARGFNITTANKLLVLIDG